MDFAHRCGFCGQGEYEFVNGPEDENRNVAAGQGTRTDRATASFACTIKSQLLHDRRVQQVQPCSVLQARSG